MAIDLSLDHRVPAPVEGSPSLMSKGHYAVTLWQKQQAKPPRPLQVYDDGRRTYIQFTDPELTNAAVRGCFIRSTRSDDWRPFNGTMRGDHYIVVDALVQAIRLELGHPRITTIDIEHD